jgi:NAD(P)H-flavin reductase
VLKARIVDILDESTSVKRFFLEIGEVKEFIFQPGQFITLSLPDGIERSYSIASSPNKSNLIELCIVLNPQGKATPYFWQLQCGDFLSFRGPLGNFVLNNLAPCDYAFICTGTGVAPFRPMLQSLMNEGSERNLYLIFGARREADLLYRREFEEWQQNHERFYYLPVLSREKWEGRRGYVHGVYEELFADKRDARFYVCGWKNMCNEARSRLKQFGYNRRQYFFEEYDG